MGRMMKSPWSKLSKAENKRLRKVARTGCVGGKSKKIKPGL